VPADMFGDNRRPFGKRSAAGSGIRFRCRSPFTRRFLGAVIIIPLMATDMLPTPPRHDGLRGPAAAATTTTSTAPRRRKPAAPPKVEPVVNQNAAPVEAPKEIKPENWHRDPGQVAGHGYRRRSGRRPSPEASSAVSKPRRRRPRRLLRHRRPSAWGGAISQPKGRQAHRPCVSPDRADRARAGHRHHRSDDWHGRPRDGKPRF